MTENKRSQEIWIDWLFTHYHHIALGGMAIALLILSVVTCQLKHSVTAVEESVTERLRFRPHTSSSEEGSVAPSDPSEHQRVYIPAHSHAYGGEGEALLLTVTLSVRNVDLTAPLQVHSINYYDTGGKLLKKFVTQPVPLGPLATAEYLVPESDISGGSGANFIVEWSAQDHVNPPIIEALMIGSSHGQGISFVQRGLPIK